MTNKTSRACTREHMALPIGFDIVRCLHGRIGVNDYAVVEAYNPKEPNHGVFLYSVVPSGAVYSLVCMWGYQDTDQQMRDRTYDYYHGQLKWGRLPIDYIMHCQGPEILRVQHSPESMDIATEYALSMGILSNGFLLYGRPPKHAYYN